jgi:energy-coupling factor transport system permease protein
MNTRTRENILRTLYPLSKLWIVLFYAIAAMLLSTFKTGGYPFIMMGSFLTIPLLAYLTGRLKKTANVLGKMWFLCFFIILLQGLFVQSATILLEIPVFGLFSVKVFEESLQYGLTLAFSVMCLGGILAWFFSSTENKDIICALEKRGMKPKGSYLLLSTLQMVSVLQGSVKTIMQAQQARGVETEGNLFIRAKAFIPSMVPLILTSINNTEERVLTLESKGFTVNGPKTRLYDIQPNEKEALVVSIFALYLLLILAWRIYTWLR